MSKIVKRLSDQSIYHYLGRMLYNNNIDRDKKINIFRENFDTNFADIERMKYFKCANILDAIFFKSLVDISIVNEIDIVGKENICNATYANVFYFYNSKFSSNVENHYFSKRGLHVAHIGSLSSYSQIDFSCFNTINVQDIKNVFLGKNIITKDDGKSLHLSQMISIFLCETSRNPTSFFTIPMCLEISEYIYKLIYEFKDKKTFSTIVEEIHKLGICFSEKKKENKTLQEEKFIVQDEINNLSKLLFRSDNQEKKLKKLEKELKDIDISLKKSSKYINDTFINVNDDKLEKSKITKDVILNLFPLSIESAVPASRYIAQKINEKLKNVKKLLFSYDYDNGSLNSAKIILTIEQNLIAIYNKYIPQKKSKIISDGYQNIILSEWYNIAEIEDLGQKCVGLIDEAIYETIN